jgi:dolichyl-phosphate beta-glucosyltransferase
LAKILTFLNSTSYQWELIIVNNASTDRTLEIASALAKANDRTRVLTEPRKGKGYAVTAGMLNATGQYSVMCDTDLSVPIEDVVLLLPPNTYGDIIIGSREKKGARRIGEPWVRHLFGRVFNILVRFLLIPNIDDTQCGFKCFSKYAREQIFSLIDSGSWTFDIEVLLIGMDLNLIPVEVPVTWTYKTGTKVSLFKDSVIMFTDVLKLYVSRKMHNQKR